MFKQQLNRFVTSSSSRVILKPPFTTYKIQVVPRTKKIKQIFLVLSPNRAVLEPEMFLSLTKILEDVAD